MKSIFIVGPTATGKTALSLHLANFLIEFGVPGVDILSADSKQVYLGEDVVTGKDKEAYTQLDARIDIHGIDLVWPDEEWSVAHFLRYSAKVVAKSKRANRVLIVVGGTGQYISALLSPPETASTPRNEKLRQELEPLSVDELQAKLETLAPEKLFGMNLSDRQNPRRLVRAIEVATSKAKLLPTHEKALIEAPLILGLELEKPELERRIRRRVQARLAAGAIEEYQRLMGKPGWTPEAKSAIGYAEIEAFLDGELNKQELLERWTLHELQYSKRQQLWLKTKLSVVWLKADEEDLGTKVEEKVRAWYTGNQI